MVSLKATADTRGESESDGNINPPFCIHTLSAALIELTVELPASSIWQVCLHRDQNSSTEANNKKKKSILCLFPIYTGDLISYKTA